MLAGYLDNVLDKMNMNRSKNSNANKNDDNSDKKGLKLPSWIVRKSRLNIFHKAIQA